MGPTGLSRQIPDTSSVYWAELPEGLDRDAAREFLGCLASRVAVATGMPVPSSFETVRETSDIAAVLDSLDPCYLNPDLLGASWEHLMSRGDRRVRGAHFTPIAVADRVVAHAFAQIRVPEEPEAFRVWDPAAGGGAFLLAAARWLEQNTDLSRARIVTFLHATDIDSMALDVCSAALEIWSGATVTPSVACADALADLPSAWPESFDVVIGNPPFLSQLSSDTARHADRRRRLAARFPDVVHGYVDESALFLHLSLDRVKPDGVVALVLPESLLAARDAHAVRTKADEGAEMTTLWVDEGQSFDAAVDVVAPVFVKRPAIAGSRTSTVSVVVGEAQDGVLAPMLEQGSWAPLLAAARGVPVVAVADTGAGCVGDLATITAGFRQHFYGLADAVSESCGSPTESPLVTSGAIDPLRPLWGRRTVKFSGVLWSAPVVELTEVADSEVREWFEARRVPKLLVASQTRVIEAVVDAEGRALPSVPVLSVEPADAADLWRLAAVVSSPVVSAWMATRSAGTGLAHTAFRVRASELARAPLPADREAWDEGAFAAQRAQSAAELGDTLRHASALNELAVAMNAAYGTTHDRLADWWFGRLRLPEAF